MTRELSKTLSWIELVELVEVVAEFPDEEVVAVVVVDDEVEVEVVCPPLLDVEVVVVVGTWTSMLISEIPVSPLIYQSLYFWIPVSETSLAAAKS